MLRGVGRLRAGGGGASLDLDFSSGVIDSRLTCSGGANGTRVNSAGVIVAATCPRLDYDPVTLAAKGLLVEEARTNLLLNSTINGANLATQSVTVTAVAHTLTFYGTGTVTLSGVSTAGPLVGSGAYPTRSTLTFTPTAGSLTLTVSGTVQFAQLEIGSFASSYIPTAGAAVTRTADSVTMTGANFSDWFNVSAGTFVSESNVPRQVAVAGTRIFYADNGVSDSISHFSRGSGVTGVAYTDGGVDQANFTPTGVISAGVTVKIASAYALNDFAASGNGGVVGTDVSGTLPTVSTIRLGSDGAVALNGHVRSLRYYPSRLPNAQLQALTA
jgi:hypothetical protein